MIENERILRQNNWVFPDYSTPLLSLLRNSYNIKIEKDNPTHTLVPGHLEEANVYGYKWFEVVLATTNHQSNPNPNHPTNKIIPDHDHYDSHSRKGLLTEGDELVEGGAQQGEGFVSMRRNNRECFNNTIGFAFKALSFSLE